MSTLAHAACSASYDPVTLLWSYPADGDDDVPTDAQLQLVLSTALLGSDWRATLNGEQLTRSADGGFPVGPLAADTAYTFRLEGRQPRTVATEPYVIELHFRTSSAPAAAVHAPKLVGPSSLADGDSAALCERVDARYVCRDTAPSDVIEIELEQADAVAWADDQGNVWPRACYPRLDLMLAEGRCYNMHAVSADGRISEPTPYCPRAAAQGGNAARSIAAQSAEPNTAASGSCSVSPAGGSSANLIQVSGAALILALQLRWRRRRRSAEDCRAAHSR